MVESDVQNRAVMRIKTSGDYAWRTDFHNDVGDQLNENTHSGPVNDPCEFTREMLRT